MNHSVQYGYHQEWLSPTRQMLKHVGVSLLEDFEPVKHIIIVAINWLTARI